MCSRLDKKENRKIKNLKHIAERNLQINQRFNYRINIKTLTLLTLSHCQLESLCDELKYLHLTYLDISANKFSEIPKCLYVGLDKLKYLNLSHNLLRTFIFEPRCYANLEDFNISHNNFTNIPKWILSLRAKNLKIFNYSVNKIFSLRCIFNNYLPVKTLILQNAALRDEDLLYLRSYPKLVHLDISNKVNINKCNMFSDINKLFINSNWENLQVLAMENLVLSIFPEKLVWCESITELYLSHNDFYWLPSDGFQYLVNLEVLDLSYNSIYTLPETLTWLEDLQVLKLAYNNLEYLPNMENMKSLQILDVYHNKLIKINCNMDHIEYMDFHENFIKDSSFCLRYEVKVQNYRKLFCKEMRGNGQRCHDLYHDILDDESDKKSYSESDRTSSIRSFEPCSPFYSTENWDSDIENNFELNNQNSTNLSTDDEWNDDDYNFIPHNFVPVSETIPSQYLNDDVLFCDAEKDVL